MTPTLRRYVLFVHASQHWQCVWDCPGNNNQPTKRRRTLSKRSCPGLGGDDSEITRVYGVQLLCFILLVLSAPRVPNYSHSSRYTRFLHCYFSLFARGGALEQDWMGHKIDKFNRGIGFVSILHSPRTDAGKQVHKGGGMCLVSIYHSSYHPPAIHPDENNNILVLFLLLPP